MRPLEDAPDCHICGKGLRLLRDHEWPEDASLILCSSCSIDEIQRLKAHHDALVSALREMVRTFDNDECSELEFVDAMAKARQVLSEISK